ncbi:MAG: ATP-binding cassette domain-containing protein [Pseudomonadota bacterium]
MNLFAQDLHLSSAGEVLLDVPHLQLNLSGITLLTGPNGSGKSLLLAALHGALPASTGTVTWNAEPAEDTRRNRGFLLQRNPVLRRSVFENLAFPLRAFGGYDEDRIKTLLDRIGLADKSDMPAAKLSGGERQRLCFARALISKPEVLLLDEPTSALDRRATEALTQLIAETAKSTPIIMSSHDRDVIESFGENRLQIEDGRINGAPTN